MASPNSASVLCFGVAVNAKNVRFACRPRAVADSASRSSTSLTATSAAASALSAATRASFPENPAGSPSPLPDPLTDAPAVPPAGRAARLGRSPRPRRAARPAGGTAGASVSGSGSGEGDPAGFSASRERFDSMIAFLDGATGAALSHAEMEERLTMQGRDLLRQLYQDHLDLRAIVMRPDALRPATARAADKATPKLAGRLSKGEEGNRKRVAEVGAVHDCTPVVVRTVADILPATDAEREHARARPTAASKWLTASVVEDAATAVAWWPRYSTRHSGATRPTPVAGSHSWPGRTTNSTGSRPRPRPARSTYSSSST